jgi:hypothetical protein
MRCGDRLGLHRAEVQGASRGEMMDLGQVAQLHARSGGGQCGPSHVDRQAELALEDAHAAGAVTVDGQDTIQATPRPSSTRPQA